MAEAKAQSGGYVFKPHERPFMPGSPASPDHPAGRRVAYFLIGIYLGLAGGFQNGLLIANIPLLQGHLSLTPVEGGWITVAYNMTTSCMSILLYKARQEFGIQRFVRSVMIALLLANFVQLFDAGYHLELISRGISGIAASGISVLASFYLMQGVPPKAKLAGMVISMGTAQVAIPLARAISPVLLESGDINHLFQLQFGMSLVAVGLVNLLHLPPGETILAFEKLDLVTFPLLATGVGLLCAFLVQGRIQWWDTPWLGPTLAASLVMIGAAFLIEHNRANPMLQTRWMASRDIVAFALTGATVRVLLSEQSFGATGLLTSLGMINDQLVTYYLILTAATVLGVVLSVLRLDPKDLQRPVIAAMALIAAAAFSDMRSSSAMRPQDLYWTQAIMAFAAVYFMGGMMMEGILRALSRGPAYIVSFSAVFGLSQAIGGLAGSAALSAFHTIRVKTHLMAMGSELSMSNPAVAAAIQRTAAAYSGTLGDTALRQARGASLLVQQASSEATIMAFNDVSFVIGIMASIAFVAMFGRWLYNRLHGINPLADELAALQAIMARNQ